MASRLLNRRELRRQSDEAEELEKADSTTEDAEAPPKKKSRAKGPAVPKVRKPRAKKAPPRMCARWGVFDGAMKQVAIFNYNERLAADEKLADLTVKKKGPFFIQIVKEAMLEPEVQEIA